MEGFKVKPETDYEKMMRKIYDRLVLFPEKEREFKLKQILEKEYGFSDQKMEAVKQDSRWRRIFSSNNFTIAGVLGLGMLVYQANKEGKLRKENTTGDPVSVAQDTTAVVIETPAELEAKIKKERLEKRFRESTYEKLPEGGKDIYKYFAENDPTPGRGYMFLDKETAEEYVFSEDNRLVAKITAGFGQDAGDESNTSFEYNKGAMTTPAGVYLLSNAGLPSDKEEYGELRFKLFGKSVLGNDESIAIHQTYTKHGELKRRTEKLKTLSTTDNLF